MCATTSGDQPLTFAWLKDGKPLHQSANINIASSPQFSTLSVQKLSLGDAGNYTCAVSNAQGTVSYTDVLEVKGKTFTKLAADTVNIASVSKTDEGSYTCRVENGVGGPLEKTVQLTVKPPPRILPFAFPRTLTVGETTSVTCTTAAGDKTFKYIWLKDGSAVHPGENVKIVTSPDISVLKIDKLTLSDAGNYTCVVSNGGGTVSHASTLEIKAPPSIAPFQFPKNLEVQQRISAMCTISVGERPLRFAWLKDGSALASGSKNVRIVDNAEYSTLHIDVLTLNSAGNYTCSVTNDAGYATYTAPLLVHEKPKLQPLVFPRNRIRVGESASALCALVAGDHDVKFRWFKENVEIGGSSVANVKVKNDKKVSVLTVEPATLQSAGNYSCTAENNYGSDANSATLVVEAVPHWTVEPKDVSVTAGQALRIECSASGFPVPNVSWRRIDPGNEAGKTAIATASGSTALIVPKTAKDAEGKYICEADNSIGAALKKIVFVKVKHAPKIQPFSFNTKVRIGDRATATCTIVTNAAPVTFTWSKDGARLQETNGLSIQETKLVSLLVIQRTETSSRGNYTCRASNVMGADQHTAELIVEAPPMWTSEPRDVSAVSGSNVTVQCTASGSPPPKITWTRTKDGGSATVPTENGRLLIHNVRVSEAGTYFCRADNGVGSAIEKSIRVIISEPPKVNPFSFTKTLSEGQSTAVTCTVTQGSKPVQLQWLKDGHEVVGSGAMKLIKHETIVVLSIEPVKVADSGNYTCVARNKYGYDRYTSSLQVNGAELKRPSEDRAQVLQNGTLVIRNATSEDSGKYSCLASNGIGAALTKTVSVLVKNAPKIQPFQLPGRVKAGDKVIATCNLASGTPPVTFSWHKDSSDVTVLSKDLSYGNNIVSALAISSVSLESQGNYTCTASNTYGSDSHTVQLKVDMPPLWIVEPTDAFGTVGGMLNLTCAASGSPEPTITWKRLSDKNSPETWNKQVLSLFPLTEAHRGKYTCDVSNERIGGRLTKTISVFVRDAPVIQPLVLPSDVVTGVNTRLLCNVQKGTRPLTFAWIKDGASVSDGVSSQDDFSLLSIDPVTAESAGNYTCVVSNAAGTDRYTSTLEVKQPSQWIEEPRDVSVAEGSEVRLTCAATGRPKPTVTWSRCVSGGQRSVVCGDSETPVPVRTSNGSVSFAHVTKKEEGRYACFVDNGVGKPLRKVIRVAVNVPAKFAEKHSVVTARRGENARLLCDAQGDQPLTVAWSKGVQKIDRGGNSRLEIFETMTDSGLRSELFISSTERSDGAVYTCRAENEFGHDERTSKLLVVEVPGQPQDVK
ncbi:hypothetical protein MRX96_045142, partial [Rhipicephalus microplus]